MIYLIILTIMVVNPMADAGFYFMCDLVNIYVYMTDDKIRISGLFIKFIYLG